MGATAVALGPVGSPEPTSAVRQSRPPQLPTLAARGRRAHADGGDETALGECEGVKTSLELRFFQWGAAAGRHHPARAHAENAAPAPACVNRYSETH